MHGPGATERYLGPTDVGSTERVEFGTGKSVVPCVAQIKPGRLRKPLRHPGAGRSTWVAIGPQRMEFCDSLSRRLDSTQRKGACFDFFGMLRDCMLRAGPLCDRTFRAKSMCSCLSFLTPSLTVTQEGVAARGRPPHPMESLPSALRFSFPPFPARHRAASFPAHLRPAAITSCVAWDCLQSRPSVPTRRHTRAVPPTAELGAGPMPDVREVLESRWDGGSLRHRGRPRWTAPTPAA